MCREFAFFISQKWRAPDRPNVILTTSATAKDARKNLPLSHCYTVCLLLGISTIPTVFLSRRFCVLHLKGHKICTLLLNQPVNPPCVLALISIRPPHYLFLSLPWTHTRLQYFAALLDIEIGLSMESFLATLRLPLYPTSSSPFHRRLRCLPACLSTYSSLYPVVLSLVVCISLSLFLCLWLSLSLTSIRPSSSRTEIVLTIAGRFTATNQRRTARVHTR